MPSRSPAKNPTIPASKSPTAVESPHPVPPISPATPRPYCRGTSTQKNAPNCRSHDAPLPTSRTPAPASADEKNRSAATSPPSEHSPRCASGSPIHPPAPRKPPRPIPPPMPAQTPRRHRSPHPEAQNSRAQWQTQSHSKQTTAPTPQSPHPRSQPTRLTVGLNPNSVDLPLIETLLTLTLQSNCTKYKTAWAIFKFINETLSNHRPPRDPSPR